MSQGERSLWSRDVDSPVVYVSVVPDVSKAEHTIAWEALVRRRTVLSPLRYPGGKRRLVPYLAAALELNDIKPDLFVEPLAGGASVALELAHAGVVEQIGLADSDPWIAAFWMTVFWDCDWLVEKVTSAEVTLDVMAGTKGRSAGRAS